MNENLKASQLPPLPNDALSAIIWMAWNGGDYGMPLTQLISILNYSSNPIPVEIAHSTYADINLGAFATYDKVNLQYSISRGSISKAGTLQITHNGTNADYSDPSFVLVGQDVFSERALGGCVFTVSLTAGQIVLRITCDSEDTETTTFKYKPDYL